ncbi:hypothetical protein PLICRDRAFT_53369 [Plicaturopsis crispa FD-325 SS-3]|nr:hypothetical protein PLICRDRAFT_53369 [Plicaturopsis crispa FD-325 SS-3]
MTGADEAESGSVRARYKYEDAGCRSRLARGTRSTNSRGSCLLPLASCLFFITISAVHLCLPTPWLRSRLSKGMAKSMRDLIRWSLPATSASHLLSGKDCHYFYFATARQIYAHVNKPAFLARGRAVIRRQRDRYTHDHIAFWNSVWLVLNDIIIGIAVGTFLCQHHIEVASWLGPWINFILVDTVQDGLVWLNDWPAGLKLNTELSRFYTNTFIECALMWSRVLQKSLPYLADTIYSIGLLSCGGISMTLAALADLFELATIHIGLCHLISALVYRRFLHSFKSLWNLFCGRRYNVLRHRRDAWKYDIDQLLFGTMLFTLIAFLFPTVLVYYLYFAMMKLAITFLHAGLDLSIATFNHFPLFMIMLWMKNPWRLPYANQTICIFLDNQDDTFFAKKQTISLKIILGDYNSLWQQFYKHYHPFHFLLLVIPGRTISHFEYKVE